MCVFLLAIKVSPLCTGINLINGINLNNLVCIFLKKTNDSVGDDGN
jgi:hypothetical protein